MDKGHDKKNKNTADAIKKMSAVSEFKYHMMTPEEVIAAFKSSKTGLSDSAATKRLDEYGANELDDEEEESLWEKIKEQFEDLLARILLLAATISFIIAITGDGEEGIAAYVEPFVILLILVLNALVAIYQDKDAENALDALKKMQAITCQVLRNGNWQLMDSRKLVPGDIVRVKMGDNIPADIRLINMNSVSFQVEEAPLTGESVSVQKQIEKLDGGDVLQDQRNMIFSSTIVNYGSADGVVVFTGMKTAIGRVQKEVQEAAEEEEDTPLKQKLDDFGEKLSYLIGAVCFIVWIMNYKNFWDEIHGSPIKGCIYYFKIAIALAVAAIPEGLPAVITTCLALGTRKMAQNNAVVRRLPSVETLGCTTIICSDKTGTLTKNEMCAVKFGVLLDGTAKLSIFDIDEAKNSYSPVNCYIKSSTRDFEADRAKNPDLFTSLATVCTYNNSSRVEVEGNNFKRVGEPTEAALKVFAEKLCGSAVDAKNAFNFEKQIGSKLTSIATLDFTSERKAMSTLVSGYKGNVDLLIKGAPDRIVNKCSNMLSKDGSRAFQGSEKAELLKQIGELAGKGLRCLAIAEMQGAGELSDVTEQNKGSKLKDIKQYDRFEQGATFLGLVCIRDPPRPEVRPALEACKTAGVRVIMITGDAQETATAIAKELNILEPSDNIKECVFTGTEFGNMSSAQKKAAVGGESGKVFARVEPSHKRELVKTLIEMGNVVAMTGDGVNDAPALKQAHIGVAMGITGTEVAKSAADMVLADDNFATIVKAVEEGRSIYSNMKAFIRYLISSNIGEVLSIFFSAFLGVPEGFTSVQLLWVNLVTDGPPATALGFNPADPDIMKKPPRRHDETLLSNWVLIRYSVIGAYVGVATVGIFIYWYTMAETGDGHTLVSFWQLTHWGQCPQWPKEEFSPVNFIEGMDFEKNPCSYFTQGKVKASTLSLSVLVVIEMLNALNAISEDSSLLTMSPFVNPYLLLAIAWSIGLHVMIVYVPVFAKIFGIAAMNSQEWFLVFAFSAPVILLDEILKIFGRAFNAAELDARMQKKKKK